MKLVCALGVVLLLSLTLQAQSSNAQHPAADGLPGADIVHVPGDYDGDGRADFAFTTTDPDTNQLYWIVRSAAHPDGFFGFVWGLGTDHAVPGDYDGDHKTDPAIYRPSTGTWWVLTSTSGYVGSLQMQWGVSTDQTVSADYDGDGRTDLAVYRPSTGIWWVLQSHCAFTCYVSAGPAEAF